MVGIASVYYQHNYGSMLQAYATQVVLDKHGIANETINISGINREIRRKTGCYFLKASFTSTILKDKLGLVLYRIRKKNPYSEFGRNIRVRDARFEEFKENFRFSDICSSIDELRRYVSDRYSSVIVGSDQLWLPGNIAGDYFTLNFVPENIKKISYATSFGQENLPKDIKKKAQQFLPRINHISVREASGKKIIHELIGKNAEVVCDPVMLLSAEDWMAFQKNEALIKGKYILCYFLGNNPRQRQFCMDLKDMKGYKLVGLLHLDEYIESDEKYVDEALYNIGPEEFINLIRNAEHVCTDSFHASVFSILYHKDFFTFRRYTNKSKQSTNGRIDSLFSQMKIARPILWGDENVSEIISFPLDYEQIDAGVDEYRKKSLKFLLDSIGE